MMKKILLTLLIALPLGVAAQTFKFGHFKSNDIFQVMPDFTQAQNELNKAQKVHEDEYSRIVNEYQKAIEEYSLAQDSLPENIADRRQKELQDMGQKVQEYSQFAGQDLEALQGKLMEPIILKLNNAIQSVGDAEGMTYIFDLSRTDIPYVNEKTSTDLTNAIKAKLGIN